MEDKRKHHEIQNEETADIGKKGGESTMEEDLDLLDEDFEDIGETSPTSGAEDTNETTV